MMNKGEKLSAEEMEKLQKQVEKFSDALKKQERFVANVVHDVKNHFAPILAYSEMIMSENITSEKMHDLAVKINGNCVALSNLLTELTNVSKARAGFVALNRQNFRLAAIAEEVVGMCYDICQNKRITLLNSLPAAQTVFADSDMVYSVFGNLVGNAIKFTPHGGTIEISGELLEDGTFQVRVKDSGVGIDLQKFEAMLRDEVTFSTEGTEGESGTGLGLLLCKELIADNGGTFRAEHNAEGGSSLIFTLPVKG